MRRAIWLAVLMLLAYGAARAINRFAPAKSQPCNGAQLFPLFTQVDNRHIVLAGNEAILSKGDRYTFYGLLNPVEIEIIDIDATSVLFRSRTETYIAGEPGVDVKPGTYVAWCQLHVPIDDSMLQPASIDLITPADFPPAWQISHYTQFAPIHPYLHNPPEIYQGAYVEAVFGERLYVLTLMTAQYETESAAIVAFTDEIPGFKAHWHEDEFKPISRLENYLSGCIWRRDITHRYLGQHAEFVVVVNMYSLQQGYGCDDNLSAWQQVIEMVEEKLMP